MEFFHKLQKYLKNKAFFSLFCNFLPLLLKIKYDTCSGKSSGMAIKS